MLVATGGLVLATREDGKAVFVLEDMTWLITGGVDEEDTVGGILIFAVRENEVDDGDPTKVGVPVVDVRVVAVRVFDVPSVDFPLVDVPIVDVRVADVRVFEVPSVDDPLVDVPDRCALNGGADGLFTTKGWRGA